MSDHDTVDKQTTLSEETEEYFHHTTTTLLFAEKRVRRIYIDLAISFLCTQVSAPTISNDDKLRRAVGYLKINHK